MARSRRFGSSYFESIRRIFHSSLIRIMLLITLIVNNGNILTDGRRYRKRLRIEI